MSEKSGPDRCGSSVYFRRTAQKGRGLVGWLSWMGSQDATVRGCCLWMSAASGSPARGTTETSGSSKRALTFGVIAQVPINDEGRP